MTNTYHVIDRLAGRLSDSDRTAAIQRMHYLEDTILTRNASAACVLGQNTGKGRSVDGSNGRVIVAVWRGRWVTAMLRRQGQEFTPQAFDVDRVIA